MTIHSFSSYLFVVFYFKNFFKKVKYSNKFNNNLLLFQHGIKVKYISIV